MAKNIFEAIYENINNVNENVNTVNENFLDFMKRFEAVEQEVIALSLMFKAPEQPNAHGEDGVTVVSSEQ